MKSPRDDLKRIYTAAIEAADPANAIRSSISCDGNILRVLAGNVPPLVYDLDRCNRIFVIGAGKATAPMALAVEEILGGRIYSGLISVKYGYTAPLSTIRIIQASHPVPDRNGVEAANGIVSLLNSAGENDLVLSLISGGGSSLLVLPRETLTLEDKQVVTDLLLSCGASIHEINAVRKHLSGVKGGNLARVAFPATVINCVISDVVGDDLDVIASGPFSPDRTSFNDALQVIDRYSLRSRVPEPVVDVLQKGAQGCLEENPAADDECFMKVKNVIIASNIMALGAAKKEAEKLGYGSVILSSQITGDTADAADRHVSVVKEILSLSRPVSAPACIISGGETTVEVKGGGLGGRNMEFVLNAALGIDGVPGVTVASIGTDGTDGPTDAAGAVADGSTAARSRERGLDIHACLDDNDSYHFFKEMGDLIITGPTNTNVMDVRIILITT